MVAGASGLDDQLSFRYVKWWGWLLTPSCSIKSIMLIPGLHTTLCSSSKMKNRGGLRVVVVNNAERREFIGNT